MSKIVQTNGKYTNDTLIKKTFYNYLIMSIIGVVSGTIGMLVDGVVVGNFLGREGLSAYGLSMPVFIVLVAIGNTFANGGIAKYGQYLGNGDREKINSSFTVNMLVSLIVSLIITILGVVFSRDLACMLGANGNLIEPTSQYIAALMLGAIPVTISQLLGNYTRLDGSSSLALISAVSMTVANVFLDIFLVAVMHYGMFALGMATSISYAIMTLVTCTHFLTKKNSLRLGKIVQGPIEIKNILVTGLPSALNRVCITIRSMITNNLALFVGGAVTMSAMSIQSNVNQLLCSVAMGIGMTTLLISSVFYGERDRSALERTLKVSLKSGFLLVCIITIIVVIFSPQIVPLFTKDAEVAATAAWSLRLFALSLPPTLINVVFLNYYQTSKNLFMANYLSAAHSFIFIALIAVIFTPLIGENGLWMSFAIGECITVLTIPVMIRLRFGKWPKNFADFLLLPDNFESEITAVLSLSLEDNMDEVMELSTRICEYLKQYIDDENKISKVSLCIEEIAGNIVKYAFVGKKKNVKHYIDICIQILDNGEILFRLRDNGKKFNPIAYITAQGDNTSTENMGIRMVMSLSKSVNYENTVNLNNLIIQV